MIYLASRSPQRAQLLTRAGVAFTVVDSACDESAIVHPKPQILALERATAKARAAVLTPAQRAGGAVVLAADTVVALGNTIFGKPADRADARRILGELQGTTHSVLTGHCCLRLDAAGTVLSEAKALALAKITMRRMTAEEIAAYVASGESDDRAGAYAIQESGDRYVTELQGSRDTVIGLNVDTALKLVREVSEP